MCVDRERAVSDILFGSILLPYINFPSSLSSLLLLLLLHFEVLLYYSIGPKPFSATTIFLDVVFITE